MAFVLWNKLTMLKLFCAGVITTFIGLIPPVYFLVGLGYNDFTLAKLSAKYGFSSFMFR